MPSFILECDTSTSGTRARFAFRRRASRSEIGSVIGLPTGFGYAGNEAREGHFPERQTRTTELADVGVAAAADAATVHDAHGTGVARQLRQAGVIALGPQFRPQRGVLLDGLHFFLVALFPRSRLHK